MRLTFFDVEFANIRNKAICQIGILSRDLSSNEEDVRIDLLINPEDEFDDNHEGANHEIWNVKEIHRREKNARNTYRAHEEYL